MIVVSPHTNERFQKLFSIKMLHEFYIDKMPRQLKIVPTEECRQVMRNYRLVFKQREAGGLVLCRGGELGQILFQDNASMKLSFSIQSADAFFINYTDLPLTSTKDVYYFSNLEENIGGNQQKLLQKNEFVYSEDKIAARPPYFNHRFEEPISTSRLWVEDAEGNQVWEQDIQLGTLESYPIDLRYDPLGKYVLKADGGYSFDFYTLMGNPQLYFGFIDIYLTDNVPLNYQAISEKNIVNQNYVIHFNNRSTRWRYLITSNDFNVQHGEFKVNAMSEKISFSDAKDVTLANGLAAKVIVSDQIISLQEHPVDKFQLQMQKNGNGIQLTINLPTPAIHSIKPQSIDDNQKIFSEVYVSI